MMPCNMLAGLDDGTKASKIILGDSPLIVSKREQAEAEGVT